MDHRVRRLSARRTHQSPGRNLRRWLVIAVLCLHGTAATTANTDEGPHLRIFDGRLKTLLEHAAQYSATLRGLLARIEAAPALVFVTCDASLSGSLSGRLGLVNRIGDLRFIQIAIRCTLPENQLIPTLAHEFQHALEIGESPHVVDTKSMTAFYEAIGFESSRNGRDRAFETTAARIIQRQVTEQLRRSMPSGHTEGAP